MNIIIKGKNWKELMPLLPEALREVQVQAHRWGVNDDEKLRMDISEFDETALQTLYKFLDERAADRSVALSRGQVKQWMEIRRDPSGCKVTKLENVPSAMKEYLAKTAPNRYLFMQNSDGNFVPFFVSGIYYHEATEYSPANVSVNLAAVSLALGLSGEQGGRKRSSGDSSITINHADISGRTISQMLTDSDWFVETPERMAEYEKEMVRFNELEFKTGLQMNVTGKVRPTEDSWWGGRKFVAIGRDGAPVKMVIDPRTEERYGVTTTCDFWEEKRGKEDRDMKLWTLPVHPYLTVFDLEEHSHCAVHVNNVEQYVYDTKVGDKLVLSNEVKELLAVLVEQAKGAFEDIVSGKSGGVIVLCQGLPGTGKTLTAEVYSEIMQRPLYKVQASQLGISIKSLEDTLKEVLGRAERWGAILLLDESDVYVRARGNEIEQNAIVGVFLRVLEYYRGVLFMTTNRGTEIDDAIISRLTARIEYTMPELPERLRIWSIISQQNNVGLSEDDIRELASDMPISGRDIKNLLKLAHMMRGTNNNMVTAALVKRLAKFKQ